MFRGDWLRKVKTTLPYATVAATVLVYIVFGYVFWPRQAPLPQFLTLESPNEFIARMEPDCLALLNSSSEAQAANPKETEDCQEKIVHQKKNYADLVQSTRAANSAEEGAYLTYLQTCLGIVGAGFVLATLVATVLATRAAGQAATAAADQAAATRIANDLARESTQRDLRAYLGIRGGYVSAPSGLLTVICSVDIPNQGKTPAHDVQRFFSAAVLDVSHSNFAPPERQPGSWVIGPGAYWTLRKELTLSNDELAAIRSKPPTKTIFLWGKLTYRDVYGKKLRVTRFRYKLWDEEYELVDQIVPTTYGSNLKKVPVFKGWGLDPTPEGNHST